MAGALGLGMIEPHPKPKHRLLAARWAQGLFKSPQDVVVLDTETTGLGEKDEIVQIAIVDICGMPLLDTLLSLSGRKAIPRDASSYHGIRTKDLEGHPCYEEISPLLRSILKNKTVVAYNAEYDFRMMRQSAAIRGGYEPIASQWQCAMKMYAMFYGDYSRRHGDYTWKKLPGTSHVATSDAFATISVLKRMAEFADAADAERQRNQIARGRERALWRLRWAVWGLETLAATHVAIENKGVPSAIVAVIVGLMVSLVPLFAFGSVLSSAILFVGTISLSIYLLWCRPDDVSAGMRSGLEALRANQAAVEKALRSGEEGEVQR